MTEITGIIYKCQHCEFTGTFKNIVKLHEEKCLSNQLKQDKNKEKQEIYDILDIDIINIKIKEFLEKYNILINHCTKFCCIEIANNGYPTFVINNRLTGGIFDRSKFQIEHKLLNEYHKIREFLDNSTTEIDEQITTVQNELDKLIQCKKNLVLDLSKQYLKGE